LAGLRRVGHHCGRLALLCVTRLAAEPVVPAKAEKKGICVMTEPFALEALEARLLLSVDAGFVTTTQIVSDPSVIEMVYDMPDLIVEQLPAGESNQPITRVSMNGAESWAGIGQPLLPVVQGRLILPYGYALDSVDVVAGDLIRMDGNFQLELYQDQWSQAALDGVGDITANPGQGEGSLIDILGVQYRRGVGILTVLLHPVEYSSETGLISYYDSLTLKVNLTPDSTDNPISYQPDDIFPLTTGVDNPDALDTYAAALLGDPPPLGSAMVNPADDYDYVIITNQALATADADYDFADFIAHKQALGYDITMVTVEDIYANYTGANQQAQIRNFIIDAYNNWGIDYVLIGGDPSVVPTKDMYIDTEHNGGSPYFNPPVASDVYYQCLDGTFDFNGNGLYGQTNDGPGGGEVDWFAEVYIGRAPFDNVERMSNWVYKTISYENSISESYRYHAEMVGEYVGFGGIADYAKPYLEEIRLGTSAHGYTTAGFASDSAFSVDTLYDKDGTWSVSTLIADINSDYYAIFNGLGHGNGGTVMKLTSPGVDSQLTNDNFFFIYSQACWPAYMYGDSIAEHLTVYTRHGAAAVIMNTNFGWGANYSTDGISQRLNRQFWDAFFTQGIDELGAMNAYSHEMWSLPNDPVGDNCWDWNVTRVVKYGTILLGDPSLKIASTDFAIYTDELPIAYQDEAYAFTLVPRYGTGPYTWTVIDGQLPAGLQLNANTGVISGLPTGLLDKTFTVQVVDTYNGHVASKEFTLVVLDRLELSVVNLPPAYNNMPYRMDLTPQGGTAPYTWSLTAGSLPEGLSLNADTGRLQGIPTVTGNYTFTIGLSDSDTTYPQTATRQYSLEVAVPPPGIYGQVFNDLNDNGQWDWGEVGLNGWTIEVVDLATGSVVATTVSAALDRNINGVFDPELECGLYSFTSLPVGHYTVRQIDPTGWNSTTLVSYPSRLFSVREVDSALTINEHSSDGKIVNSFPAPQSTLFPVLQGLAVGPDSLFFIDSGDLAAQPVLYELNLETGAIIDSDVIPGALPALTMGMAMMGSVVYLQYSANTILAFSCATDQVINTLTLSVTIGGGLTAAPDLGLLFASSGTGVIYAIDPDTGAVVNSFNPGAGLFNGGMAYHNGELLAAPLLMNPSNLISRINPLTGALLGTLQLRGTGNVVALGGDMATPAAYGAYRVRLAANDIVIGKDFGNEVILLGDVDRNGSIDAADIDAIFGGFGPAGAIDHLMDLDADGDVDVSDVDLLVRDILNSEYGDANLMGQVDTVDLTILATNFGTNPGWAGGDFNGDGVVNTVDLTILGTNFGFVAAPAPPPLGAPLIVEASESAALASSVETPDQLLVSAPTTEETQTLIDSDLGGAFQVSNTTEPEPVLVEEAAAPVRRITAGRASDKANSPLPQGLKLLPQLLGSARSGESQFTYENPAPRGRNLKLVQSRASVHGEAAQIAQPVQSAALSAAEDEPADPMAWPFDSEFGLANILEEAAPIL